MYIYSHAAARDFFLSRFYLPGPISFICTKMSLHPFLELASKNFLSLSFPSPSLYAPPHPHPTPLPTPSLSLSLIFLRAISQWLLRDCALYFKTHFLTSLSCALCFKTRLLTALSLCLSFSPRTVTGDPFQMNCHATSASHDRVTHRFPWLLDH